MKYEQYFIIRFEDLKEDKQDEIKEWLHEGLIKDDDIRDELEEKIGSDPFDLGRIDADGVMLYLEQCIEGACNRSWTEWEIVVKI